MNRVETGIDGLVVIEPRVFKDDRGFFFETFSSRAFAQLGLPTQFVQDNFSRSKKNVLRGLHYQSPNAQGKLVRVTSGAVWDVAVDIRPNSPTYGKHFGLELSADNQKSFYVPEGFAHGFCTLTDFADFQYKCTAFYSPADEKGLLWNDPDLGIRWPVADPILNAKDLANGRLRDLCPSSGA